MQPPTHDPALAPQNNNSISNAEEHEAALSLNLRNCIRHIDIFSYDLSIASYCSKEFADNVSALARRHRLSRIRILLQSTEAIARRSHPIKQLYHRLPSSITIKKLDDSATPPKNAFCICDRKSLVLLTHEQKHIGFYHTQATAEAKALAEEFDYLWGEWSHEDTELKKLCL